MCERGWGSAGRRKHRRGGGRRRGAYLGSGQEGVPGHESPERGAERIGAGERGGAPPAIAPAQGGVDLGQHEVQRAAGGEEVHAASESAQRDPGAHAQQGEVQRVGGRQPLLRRQRARAQEVGVRTEQEGVAAVGRGQRRARVVERKEVAVEQVCRRRGALVRREVALDGGLQVREVALCHHQPGDHADNEEAQKRTRSARVH